MQGLDIRANNAAADGLPAALTGAAHTVARVALTEEEANTVGQQNTLLHRETLLVVTTADTEDVALPLVTERVDLNILGHALVVEAAPESVSTCATKTGRRTRCAHQGTQKTSARPWQGWQR